MKPNRCKEMKAKRSPAEVDIVLVIDYSSDIRNGKNLKDELCRLGHDLFADGGWADDVDLRLGLVTHDVEGKPAVKSCDFVESGADFVRRVNDLVDGINEFGLPAVDLALDFFWRGPSSDKYIAFLSGEPMAGGHAPGFQLSKLYKLCQKLIDLHVIFLGMGPPCEAYSLLGKTPGSSYKTEAYGFADKLNAGELFRKYLIDYLMKYVPRIRAWMPDAINKRPQSNLYELSESLHKGGILRGYFREIGGVKRGEGEA